MSASQLDERGVIVTCPNCGQRNRIAYDRLDRPPRCGRCKQAMPLPADPIEIRSVPSFDALVRSSSLPVLVDFWAPWCGPCRMVASELAKVAAANAGRFIVIKVNTDELPALSERYRVTSIPMLGLFAGGRQVASTVGVRPAADIEAFLDGAIVREHPPAR
jgi:thioredoxin 2